MVNLCEWTQMSLWTHGPNWSLPRTGLVCCFRTDFRAITQTWLLQKHGICTAQQYSLSVWMQLNGSSSQLYEYFRLQGCARSSFRWDSFRLPCTAASGSDFVIFPSCDGLNFIDVAAFCCANTNTCLYQCKDRVVLSSLFLCIDSSHFCQIVVLECVASTAWWPVSNSVQFCLDLVVFCSIRSETNLSWQLRPWIKGWSDRTMSGRFLDVMVCQFGVLFCVKIWLRQDLKSWTGFSLLSPNCSHFGDTWKCVSLLCKLPPARPWIFVKPTTNHTGESALCLQAVERLIDLHEYDCTSYSWRNWCRDDAVVEKKTLSPTARTKAKKPSRAGYSSALSLWSSSWNGAFVVQVDGSFPWAHGTSATQIWWRSGTATKPAKNTNWSLWKEYLYESFPPQVGYFFPVRDPERLMVIWYADKLTAY